MSAIESAPNDPELFQRLINNMYRLTDDFGMPIYVDQSKTGYPVNPNNLRALGEQITSDSLEHQRRSASGKAMFAGSRGSDEIQRNVIAYTFGKLHQRIFERVGEVIINTEPVAGHMTLDIHRVLLDGRILTSSVPDDSTRQLHDYELAHLVEIAESAIPSW